MLLLAAAKESQRGIALLGAMMLVLILSLIGATLLHLAGQESVHASAVKTAAVTQQLADAAGQVVVAMFHSPGMVPPTLASTVTKRGRNPAGVPSFFDQAGHSQFVGTAVQPDMLLDARNASDNRVLNDPQTGLFHPMQRLGAIQELKIYAPTRPGLLCTVDATVSSQASPSVRQSVTMQLGALDVPPLRAGVQIGGSLGAPLPGKESSVRVHWGDLKVEGDLALHRADDLPTLTGLAAVTGQGYDDMVQREDRWMEAWIGGEIRLTQVPAGQTQVPTTPQNVHINQIPAPGVHLDQWDYDQLKAIARQYGRYFAIDREGLLYQGTIQPGQGISPDSILQSHAVGDQEGLVFIDTLDQKAPRADNLGTVTIHSAYVEGMVVVQGHIVLSPGGAGQSLSVLSPPTVDRNGQTSRVSVQLSQINVNGLLYAAGNVTLAGKVRVFGAVTAGGTVDSGGEGSALEVWYNHEYAQGLYRGLPVVYPASGTWMTRY